jgi:5-hydroxyisourate hydrolase
MAKATGGRLTTHVLDTASGKPAAGLRIELFRLDGSGPQKVAEAVTNSDGRCDAPLLADEAFAAGQYELLFALSDPAFLDDVPIRFGMAEATHYHVPLLLSPFGYSTYRGS